MARPARWVQHVCREIWIRSEGGARADSGRCPSRHAGRSARSSCRTARRGFLAAALAGVSLAAPLCAAAQVTIHFDGTGLENGVTEAGTRDFSFMGSEWSGGVVRTVGILPLYASGRFSYEASAGGASVVFAPPVSSVRFFYVHGFGFAPGVATAFAAGGETLAAVSSRSATSFADPANFVDLESGGVPISRIEFSAGVIDDFTFRAAPVATVTEIVVSSPTTTPTLPPPATGTASPTPTPTATQTPIECGGTCDTGGDLNCDGVHDRVDVELLLAALFCDPCRSCANHDVDADGRLSAADVVLLIRLLAGDALAVSPAAAAGSWP